MEQNKIYRKRWYQLDDRRLQAQRVFWVVVGLPSILVFGAAAWVLAGYEIDLTSQGVEHLVKVLAPFVPWFAFVAALAALVARMHATVQTEVQIDTSNAESRFGMYLRHRDYIEEQTKSSKSALVSQNDVEIHELYRAIFPCNGFDQLYLSCHASKSGSDVFDEIRSYLRPSISEGLVYRRRSSIDQWLFNSDFLYQRMATTLAWLGIPLPEKLANPGCYALQDYGDGAVGLDELAGFISEYVLCIRVLMQLSHKEKGDWVQELEIFLQRLRAVQGQVDPSFEDALLPKFCK